MTNFKPEVEVIQFISLNSSFVFRFVRTDEAVDAKFKFVVMFLERESLPSFFFRLMLVRRFFYSLAEAAGRPVDVSFWVAANLRTRSSGTASFS